MSEVDCKKYPDVEKYGLILNLLQYLVIIEYFDSYSLWLRFAAIGGSIGALLGIRIFHHETSP